MDPEVSGKHPVAVSNLAVPDLVSGLQLEDAYDHPTQNIKLVETHISWVLLTGDYAYKIKKPVDFGFLDYSTLEKRQFFCAEEVRLNRRYSPQIYLDTVAIRGTPAKPRFYGEGAAIEYAVKMREFSQQDLLSAYAVTGRLTAELVDTIADTVAGLHANASRSADDTDYGSASLVTAWSRANLSHIDHTIPADALPEYFDQLKSWCMEKSDALGPLFNARKENGMVRDCHGDLHLGNMALIDGRVSLFDCIEFDPALRWIDSISEAAFIAMDLYARGYAALCWQFINRYLQTSGDFDAIALLRYYFVYRALVRAKVEALRLAQGIPDAGSYRSYFKPALDFISLANLWSTNRCPGMIIMHGLSGSGKSTVAARLAKTIGAIQIRSDIERKRLFALTAQDRSSSALDQGIYSAMASESTYLHLFRLAEKIIHAGYTVILDATFLRETWRQQCMQLAAECMVTAIIVDCEIPDNLLRERIISRSQDQADASEANLEVLDRQLQTREPIGSKERRIARVVTCSQFGLGAKQLHDIERWLHHND